MSEQLDFSFGGDLGQRPPRFVKATGDNFLFGIRSPSELAQELGRIKREAERRFGTSGKQRPPHISLVGFGREEDWYQANKLHLRDVFAAVCLTPFTVTFDHMMSFGGSGALVLCSSQKNQALEDLYGKVVELLHPAGIEARPGQKFNPHLTLFYTRKTIDRQPLDRPVHWQVTEFWMLRSLWGKAEYEELWSVPLVGGN